MNARRTNINASKPLHKVVHIFVTCIRVFAQQRAASESILEAF